MIKLSNIDWLRSLTALACVLCISLFMGCGGGTRGTTDTGIEVRGILVDFNGLPVANAPVSAGGVNGVTDINGAFALVVPEGTNEFAFEVAGAKLTAPTPAISAAVAFEFKVNESASEVSLVGESPIFTPTPTRTPEPQATQAPTPTPQPELPTPTPTPAPALTAISLASNENSFSFGQTATFTITAVGGQTSSTIGKSIVLVVGTLGTGQTSITFSNNETVEFPTSASDLYYTLSIQNFVQIMQTGSVVFNLPVGAVSTATTLFARALAVDSSNNSLVSLSDQVTIELLP